MARKGSGGFKSAAGAEFGTLQQVFDDVWWAWGTVRVGPGVAFPRNMVLVREADGGLVAIHPVMMPPAEQAKIEALGPIKHIVRLGAMHGMDDPAYVARYHPTTWAHPEMDLREGATRDRPLVAGGATPIAGATAIEFASSLTPELVLHLPRHGGIVLACDAIQNWERAAGVSLFARPAMRIMGFTGRACLGPRWRKLAEPKDGTGFRPVYEQIAALEFQHAIGAHGSPMLGTARDDLRAAMAKAYS